MEAQEAPSNIAENSVRDTDYVMPLEVLSNIVFSKVVSSGDKDVFNNP